MDINSVFDREEYKEYKSRWESRKSILLKRRAYATGDIYNKRWRNPELQGEIKSLYLPLSKAVDVDAGIIPGINDPWELQEDVPDAISEAMQTVFKWSNWSTDGVLYVHYGAQMGPTGLKVVDLQEEKRVMINPADPLKFMLVETNDYNPNPKMSFYVETRGDGWEYAEVITPELIRTFKDGELTSFGEREPEYENAQEFIPYIETVHKRTGSVLGESTFDSVLPMLDAVNEIATALSTVIEKNVAPQWMAMGAEPSDMFKSSEAVWFMPEGSNVKALTANIDIKGVLEFVREIAQNVKDELPEKSFELLKSQKQIAAETLGIMLFDLILKINRVRPNYDDGLERAMRLAGRAAKKMGLSDIAVLDSEELQINSERQMLPIDPVTELKIKRSALELEREEQLTRSGFEK